MLDVLIIGGGPHALTLASLLCVHNPEQNTRGTDHCHTYPELLSHSPQERSSKTNRHKSKNKRNVALNTNLVDEPILSVVSDKILPHTLSLRVVDSYGEWTGLWEGQFTALKIPNLRSHTLVHTDPLNKRALQEFVVKHDRTAELYSLPDQVYILDENAFFNDMRLGKKEKRRLNMPTTLKKSLSFSLPGTRLSVDFFKEQVCV